LNKDIRRMAIALAETAGSAPMREYHQRSWGIWNSESSDQPIRTNGHLRPLDHITTSGLVPSLLNSRSIP
jgi:hypothetical protein